MSNLSNEEIIALSLVFSGIYGGFCSALIFYLYSRDKQKVDAEQLEKESLEQRRQDEA